MDFDHVWVLVPLLMYGPLVVFVGSAATTRWVLKWWSGRRNRAAEHVD